MSQLVLSSSTAANLHHHQPPNHHPTIQQEQRPQEQVVPERSEQPYLNAHTTGDTTATTSTTSASLDSASSGDPDASLSRTGRPRRKAAIASQAATSANWASGSRQQGRTNGKVSTQVVPSKPQRFPPPAPGAATVGAAVVATEESSVPTTPATATRQAGSAQQRVMAALPRAKRPRRSAHEPDFGQAMDLGSHPSSSLSSLSSSSHRNGNDVNGYGHTNGSITGGTAVGSTSANPMLQHHSTLVPGPSINGASYRNGASASKQSSVREVIAGKEREVFVVDSTSPPSSTNQHQQHAWNNSDSAAGLANPYATATGSTVPKGKRKAGASPLATKPTSGQTQTALQKRRRYDAAEKAAVDRERGLHPAPAATNHYVDREALSYVAPPPTHTVDDKEGHLIVRSRDYVTGRYQIIRQLGQGTFGKVVECYDIKTRKMVAIKVIRAVQKYRDASKIEIRVLDTLRQHDPLNQNKCIHLLDTFDFLNHVCIVSELLGQSVFDFLKDNSFLPFPSRHIWSFAKQLLQSVAFLHRLGLIHTDLKPENILLVNHDYDSVPLTRRANSKRKRVLKESEIRLIDFGSATFQDEYHSMVVSTRHYRAPEIILQMGWTFPCDAWSIGCILVEFFTGEALFQTHDNLEHLAMMEAVLGVMPDDYRRKAETYLPAYFKHGRLDYPNKDTQKQSKKYVKAMKSLDDIIRCPPSFSKFESRFKHLIKRLLTFDPEQRIRVDQALHHPFFELTEDEIPP